MYGATIGKVAILNFETTTNQACCVFSSSFIIDMKFLYHWFKGNKQNIINLAIGGGQPNISQDILKGIRLYCPEIKEQTQIAAYLDHKTKQLDDLIASKQRLIELLEEERTATINHAVTKGINPDAPLKDSGIEWLGEIPEHWEVKKIKYVAILKSGDNITSEQINTESKYPVFGGNGVRGYFDKYNNDGNHILVGRQGALCGNIKFVKGKFWASEHAVVCYLHDEYEWIWFGKLLESMNLNQYNQSAAQPGLAIGLISNLSIPSPNFSEQQTIVSFILDYEKVNDKQSLKLAQEIELLQEYKTALISEVVTGKVDVREEVLD
jgi:type I restriction enzyme S subunit